MRSFFGKWWPRHRHLCSKCIQSDEAVKEAKELLAKFWSLDDEGHFHHFLRDEMKRERLEKTMRWEDDEEIDPYLEVVSVGAEYPVDL